MIDWQPQVSCLHDLPIRLSGVTYQIGQAVLVRDLSFEVRPSETVVLVGRSGSGKTTALRLVNNTLMPTSGEVTVEGRRTSDWDPIRLRRRVGYVIQDIGLFPHLTVARNISLITSLEGSDADRIEARTHELLDKVGLPADILTRYPGQLSGGQRQRVGAADPPMLLMDEPFGALDPITRAEIQREFLAIQADLGQAMLFVTHDLREALLLGNRIGLMDHGRVVWMGGRDEFRSSADPNVSAFRESLE